MQLSPIYLEPGSAPAFPKPDGFPPEGLVAVGGDLASERLLLSYDMGIFPWYTDRDLPLWWSPDPRAVIDPTTLHVSRSLERRLHRGEFRLTWNHAFPDVIRECSRERKDGTWIHPEVIEAYVELHRMGLAHSIEVWVEGSLAGGLYGVQRGAMFAAESKFHRRRDMSKVALVACVRSVFRAGIELFDVQHNTSHLVRLGVVDWPRERYLSALRRALQKRVDLSDLELDWRE